MTELLIPSCVGPFLAISLWLISGKIIGFYSAANQGVYTHPGESWHLHLVIEKEGKAGHIDAFSVRKGTVLKLPVS